MSDLEATSSRGQSAAQVTAIAAGKLRALSRSGPVFAHSNGLVDAFAEVFARIASSSHPIESLDPIADSEESRISTDEGAQRPDQSESAESEPVKTDSDAETIVKQLITEVDDQHALAADTGQKDAPDNSGTERIDIAAVEVSPSNSGDDEIESSKVIVQEVEPDDAEHDGRERRKSTSVEPVENTEGGRGRSDRSTNEQQIGRGSEEIGENDEPLEQADQDDRKESPRRLRGRRRENREPTDNTQRPVAQASQGRGQQTLGDAAVSGDSLANQAGRTPDAPSRPVTTNVESTIASAQSIASRVQQSSTVTGAQTGARGSTQTLESPSAARTASSPKPDSKASKSNAAETVSRIKLIQRVSKAFQHLGPEGGVVRLRLAPAEMGSVRVEMRINQRKVQARVVAETEAASTALREHLPDLRARLESFGMQVEKLEIETDTQDHHHGSQFDAQSQEQQQRQRQDDHWLARPTAESNESVSPEVPHRAPADLADNVSSGVDVRL